MGNRPAVELHQAFSWTCDECGRDSFARGVTLDPESVDLADVASEEVRELIEAGIDGDWIMAPTHVECPHCGAKFEAEAH